jgi:enoyl-CoA hydratase
MELILTGRFITAAEAYEAGLVTKVVAKEQFLAEAIRLAETIASKSPVATRLAKEAVLAVDELGLTPGIEYERKLFYSLFATFDQKEGMKAFLEKRKPRFEGK